MKTIVLDMYGVILEESKGNFIPYTYSHFPAGEHDRLQRQFRDEQLFTRAGNGEFNSNEFLTRLGYQDPEYHMRDYIENHLTLDPGFVPFASRIQRHVSFALLSNDVSRWSAYITDFYDLNRFFTVKVVSGDVGCRKPDGKIYQILLERLGRPAGECLFIDNSVRNLVAARELGIQGILFNRDNEVYDGETVSSFEELGALLSSTWP